MTTKEELIVQNKYLKRRVEQLIIRVESLNRNAKGGKKNFTRFICDKCKKGLGYNKFKNVVENEQHTIYTSELTW